MDSSKFYLFSICFMFVSKFSNSANNNKLLLIVSFDGFRYDYLDRNLTETLLGLRKNSTYSPNMLSVFPTKTFPNHFSIATGLYTEVHGVLDNKVYDKSSNKSLGYGYELFHYNEEIVPIWTLNERGGEGRHSGCMMWPGSDLPYQKTLPSHFKVYNVSVSWHSRVDTVISWFTHPDIPINLGMMYFEQPDLTCHSYGPDSLQVNSEIARVDKIVQYLLKKALEVGILHRLNIIFLSDHGGQAVPVPSHSINLDTYVNRTWYYRDGVPPNLQIYPLPGKEEEVLSALKSARDKGGHFSTYTKEEILERWRYKHCRRTPPILLCAEEGYLFHSQDRNYTTTSTVIGTHGYDPEDIAMRAFFMALGPEFKKNYSIKPFENVHIFPLAAHILNLSLPTIRPNGSLVSLQDILIESAEYNSANLSKDDHSTIFHAVSVTLGVFILILSVGALLYWKRIRHQKLLQQSPYASYTVLNQTSDDREAGLLSSDCEQDPPA